MLTTVLWTAMVLHAAPKQVDEVWEGTLYVEFMQAKPKQRRVKRSGDVLPLKLEITRKGRAFTGKWIEGDRSLAVEGTMNRGVIEAVPTRVLKGNWNNEILGSLRISGEFKKGKMAGWLYGVGNRRVRGGEFELQKKP
jgi:hypothetical protein